MSGEPDALAALEVPKVWREMFLLCDEHRKLRGAALSPSITQKLTEGTLASPHSSSAKHARSCKEKTPTLRTALLVLSLLFLMDCPRPVVDDTPPGVHLFVEGTA